jgi:signal transduction histidine kinase
LGVEIILELDDSMLPVIGNTYKFEQVILNLVINAKDALEDRRRKPKEKLKMICVKSYFNEHTCFIEVIDNGIGIEPGEIEKIMLPFHTTKEAGLGTGLGLSISFEIIREMKGNMEVLSEINSGTTIRIILPTSDKSENRP